MKDKMRYRRAKIGRERDHKKRDINIPIQSLSCLNFDKRASAKERDREREHDKERERRVE